MEDGRYGKIVSNTHTFSSKSVKKKQKKTYVSYFFFKYMYLNCF